MLPAGSVIEVGHLLEEGIPTFPEHAPFRHRRTSEDERPLGFLLELHEHAGTHVDAPSHWTSTQDGDSIEKLDPFALVGPCIVVDAGECCAGAELTATSVAGRVASTVDPGTIVLFRFGWDSRWHDPPAYLNGWPGLGADLAEALVAAGVKAVGTDAPAIDSAGPHGMPAHEMLLGAGVPVMENLCNLRAATPSGFFVALPLRIEEGSGSPIRPVVILPHTASQ